MNIPIESVAIPFPIDPGPFERIRIVAPGMGLCVDCPMIRPFTVPEGCANRGIPGKKRPENRVIYAINFILVVFYINIQPKYINYN
jgi:hypothetical protein